MVAKMIDRVHECESGDERLAELAAEIAKALTVHSTIEEEHFYPLLRDCAENGEERIDVFEAFTEHGVVKHLIDLVQSGRKDPDEFKAELQVLGENVKHHIREEESTIFALAREVMNEGELNDIGDRMAAEKEQLMSARTSRRRAAGKRTTRRERTGTAKRTGAKKRTTARGKRTTAKRLRKSADKTSTTRKGR
jgi:hemerythrin-like domain-containing protein